MLCTVNIHAELKNKKEAPSLKECIIDDERIILTWARKLGLQVLHFKSENLMVFLLKVFVRECLQELLWGRHLYLHWESLHKLLASSHKGHTSAVFGSTLQLYNCHKSIILSCTGHTEVFWVISVQNGMRKFLRTLSRVKKWTKHHIPL